MLLTALCPIRGIGGRVVRVEYGWTIHIVLTAPASFLDTVSHSTGESLILVLVPLLSSE